MTKGILIDSAARMVGEVDYDGLADLQRFVGGYIEVVASAKLGQGDALFVDEDGLSKPQMHFFLIEGHEQPIAGCGIVVGGDRSDDDGEELPSLAPIVTVEELRARVRFMSRAEVDSWGKANASEPSHTIISFGTDGTVTKQVLGHVGSLFAGIPRPVRSKYSVMSGAYPWLVITDDGGDKSVTNDAELVVEDLVRAGYTVDQLRLIYRDSMGRWDGLKTRNGIFVGFRALGGGSLRDAMQRWEAAQ